MERDADKQNKTRVTEAENKYKKIERDSHCETEIDIECKKREVQITRSETNRWTKGQLVN